MFNHFCDNVIFINNEPNGLNINDRCGSTDTKHLAEAVVENKAQFGIAFDGDADRIIFVDAEGTEVDGDYLLYILASKYLEKGKLRNNKIAVTTMSNLGIIKSLKTNLDVDVVTTDVGDKYVAAALEEEDLLVGGEASGHIILRDKAPSGDGILVALQVLEYLEESAQNLSSMIKALNKFPSALCNVKVADKNYSLNHRNVIEEIKRVENILSGNGRVLVRPSGTEQLIRVLVECEDETSCNKFCDSIASSIREVSGKEV